MAVTTWLATISRVRLVRLAADTTDEWYLVPAGDVPPRLNSSPARRWVPRVAALELCQTRWQSERQTRTSVRSGSSVKVTERQRRLLALCAIRVDGASVDWSLIARQAQFEEGLDALWAGRLFETSAAAKRCLPVLRRGIRDAEPLAERVEAEIQAAGRAGARLVTVLDEDYPPNLRLIPNLPPFLFYRGTLGEADTWSVAVVGTRRASAAGIERAARLSGLLVSHHVTVISGLARGIDTAVHRADAGQRRADHRGARDRHHPLLSPGKP